MLKVSFTLETIGGMTLLFWFYLRVQSVLCFLTVGCAVYVYLYSYWKQGKVLVSLHIDKSGHDLATSYVFSLRSDYFLCFQPQLMQFPLFCVLQPHGLLSGSQSFFSACCPLCLVHAPL